MRDDWAVEVKRDRLLVRGSKAEVEVLASEIRHLVNALAEAAGRFVDLKDQYLTKVIPTACHAEEACPART